MFCKLCFCDGINYFGLTKMSKTNGAILTFVKMCLLNFNSIKAISDEYEYRGSSIITDEMHCRCAFYRVYIMWPESSVVTRELGAFVRNKKRSLRTTNLSKTYVWLKSHDMAIDFKRVALLCLHA